VFWPRDSILRRPGTLVVEFLPVIPPGLPRETFKQILQERIEIASAALLPLFIRAKAEKANEASETAAQG
jgi:hypothetical protein